MSAFDEKLRDMAHRDSVPLPEGYDEMLQELYGSLAEDDGTIRKQACSGKRRKLPRLLAAAAIVALMAASMAVGALAFSSETVVEIPVPAEQESVTLDELGLTLILPDTWKGKYTMEKSEFGNYQLYINSIHEANRDQWGGGILFYILEIQEVLTPEQIEDSEWNYAANRYLFATKDSTYLLYYASDVQWNPSDPAQEAEYRQMMQEISQIRIVVDRVLA